MIPAKALLLDALLGPFGGGPWSLNGVRGLECLAEPDDEGRQPQWTAPWADAAGSAGAGAGTGAGAGAGSAGGAGWSWGWATGGADKSRPLAGKDEKSSVGAAIRAGGESGAERQSTVFGFGDVYADKSEFVGSSP